MSNLFLTLVIAFVIIVLAIASLAIGWLITGKTRIERGSCGRNPNQKKDESCKSTCDLCSTSEENSAPISEEISEEAEEMTENTPEEIIHTPEFSPDQDWEEPSSGTSSTDNPSSSEQSSEK